MNKGPPPPYGMHVPPAYMEGPTAPQPTVFVAANYGPSPCSVVCPSCHAHVMTRTDIEATTKTHLFALLLCLICCPLGIIPYCTDSCQSTTHYCPSCGAYLGIYDR